MKPLQVGAPLYESYWLYGAGAPTTGDAFGWAFPRLDAEGFTLLLRHFGPHYAESRNSVRLAQAPAQVAQRVQCPEPVLLRWLPASSPALNPVERLWEDLKARSDVLDGRVRSRLAMLQDHVADLVQRYTTETIAA